MQTDNNAYAPRPAAPAAAPAPGLWFGPRPPSPQARLLLFCFPSAGGRAATYQGWHAGLPAGIEVVAVQPLGRAGGSRERPFDRLKPLVEALAFIQAEGPLLLRSLAGELHTLL